MAIALLMLSSDKRLDIIEYKYKFLILSILACCILVLIPNIFNKLVSAVYKITKRAELNKKHQAGSKTIITGALLYTISALASGLSLFFIAKAIYPELSYGNIFFVMGAGNLASAASMLAFFAPSGLGVREGIQLTLLSLIMPTELALLVTITTRLWSVMMDIIFFGITKLIKK